MTSQLRKINNVIEQFLLPLAEAVSGWSTLAAIRSALIVTLPLMFLGSLAELLISFPLDAYKEFSSLVEQADAIHDDLDARYKAFAKAEAYMIQHALTVPNYYNIGWMLTKVNPYSKMKAMYGIQNNKMKNWETNADGYTAEQVAALKEAHESGK